MIALDVTNALVYTEVVFSETMIAVVGTEVGLVLVRVIFVRVDVEGRIELEIEEMFVIIVVGTEILVVNFVLLAKYVVIASVVAVVLEVAVFKIVTVKSEVAEVAAVVGPVDFVVPSVSMVVPPVDFVVLAVTIVV